MLSLLAREPSSSEPGDKTEGRKILRKLYEWEGFHIVKAEVYPRYRPYVGRNSAQRKSKRDLWDFSAV